MATRAPDDLESDLFAGAGRTEDDEERMVDPQPVYLRLDDLAFRSYYPYAMDENLYDEDMGDDPVGMDLTAPPPDS